MSIHTTQENLQHLNRFCNQITSLTNGRLSLDCQNNIFASQSRYGGFVQDLYCTPIFKGFKIATPSHFKEAIGMIYQTFSLLLAKANAITSNAITPTQINMPLFLEINTNLLVRTFCEVCEQKAFVSTASLKKWRDILKLSPTSPKNCLDDYTLAQLQQLANAFASKEPEPKERNTPAFEQYLLFSTFFGLLELIKHFGLLPLFFTLPQNANPFDWVQLFIKVQDIGRFGAVSDLAGEILGTVPLSPSKPNQI